MRRAQAMKSVLSIPTLVLTACLAPGGPATAQQTFSEETIEFRSPGATLSGTLLVPDGPGPHPAVVFLHGSGPMTRAGFMGYAREYARMGVATLAYDKRGAGESSGELLDPMPELADDAAAAVEYLRSRDDVDADRIGFWGISQAGWIAPLAARRTDGVSFIIMISGGGAAPKDSELFSWRRMFEGEGLSARQSETAMSLITDYFDYLTTGHGRAPLVARIDSLRRGALAGLQDLPAGHRDEFVAMLDRILPAHENLHLYAMLATYDPVDDIAALGDMPVLLLFGDRDTDHPTDLALQKWREGFERAGNTRGTIVVFPGAGHGIRMREGWTGEGRAPFADGYRDLMTGWLWRHVVDPSPER